MRELVDFWNKDIINKLIVIISVLLVLAIFAFIILILNMPAGRTVSGAIGEYFPTATLEPKVVLTRSAEKAKTQSAAATASVVPTMTTMPFTPIVKSPTPGEAPTTEPTPTSLPATATLPPTPKPIIPTSTPVASPTLAGSQPASGVTPLPGNPANSACIPANPSKKGRVLDVLDGNTIKVIIDGLTYVVRYIGVETPTNPIYTKLAAQANGKLVFAKEVTLVADVTEKDANGRLLRYVKVGDTFVNLELIQKGLATTLDSNPNSACASVFMSAEQTAHSGNVGLWKPTPAPSVP